MDSQLENNYIEKLLIKNIPITWGFLLLGLNGPGTLSAQLNLKQIIDYSLNLYLSGHNNKLVEDIAFAREDEDQLIKDRLEEMSFRESNSANVLTKWEYLLLEEFIPQLSNDPLTALLELTNFWSQFDFPENSPHQVQGRNNLTTPEEYFTQKNYIFLLNEHKKWLKKTEENLKTKE